MKWSARGGWLLLALVAWGAGVRGQGVPGRIEGFQVPDYDKEGRLRSRVFGDVAELQPDGRLKITELRIQIYRDGVLEATLWAAECFYDRKARTAVSDTPVRLERGALEVSGIGLRWSADEQRVTILEQVKVVLKERAIWPQRERKEVPRG